ncbi:MAG: glycosyl hydrolase 53 family protein [Prevotella sp.]|nr:glycosyl hydrolase 53 family protein [Prevotella sp.]
MKLKTLLISLLTTVAVSSQAQTTKVVGGDLSLVPAYEAAGDVWLDANGDSINTKYADGNSINTKYADGMITYVRDVAKWNAVRVRLLVDPTVDDTRVLYNDSLATCQDIEYVKKLGKRIKDAGMNFLLDIFYSDTWTDVSRQWMPKSWGFNRNTATATVAAKVKSYTTEVLNALTAYGAKPDYVQIGNEVSYGMLWDDIDSRVSSTWYFNNSTYDQTKVERFATLLKAAAEGVRASNASTAKIVLHNERTEKSGSVKNFYTWVEQAGFTDYDIIGLSYYPQWHGNISNLSTTLNLLEYNFPSKKIQIVETGYPHTQAGNITINTSSTWPYSPAGQAAFLTDLITELNKHNNVDGLYYWQPEECGNGAGADDVGGTKHNRVMNHWDYRGFWKLGWESGSHALDSKDALMTLMTFIGETPDEQGGDETEVTDFENLDFENGESNYKWTINWDQGWTTNWFYAPDQWVSSLITGNWFYKTWIDTNNTIAAGNLIYQSKDNMPAGVYTISAAIHNENAGIYLFANDDKISIPLASAWSDAKTVSIQTTLNEPGTLTFGITIPEAINTTASTNLYADNFKVTRVDTGVDSIIMDEAKTKDKPIKVLRNGMVLIEKNGRTYNAQGQIVK